MKQTHIIKDIEYNGNVYEVEGEYYPYNVQCDVGDFFSLWNIRLNGKEMFYKLSKKDRLTIWNKIKNELG